ncbi:MAG: ribonuclease Z [Gammaproteobacteria bacterium]|nr:MAG: ribonuclease Z [Gammaproteobacteria bacterium]
MDLLFLGTSSGTPTKTRNVTGLALIEEKGSAWYLIDCGEGTQHQLLHTSLSINDLKAIFITHVHGDHCYGLPGLLASAGMHGRKSSLKVIAPKGIADWFHSTQTHTQLYLPFEIQFVETESLIDTEFGNFLVSSATLSHRVPSYAYVFTENSVEANLDTEKLTLSGIPKGPLWGMLKKGINVVHDGKTIQADEYLKASNKPRKIVIGGDNDRPDLLIEACHNCNVLVHEATYTSDVAAKVGDGVGHSYAGLVASFAEMVSIPHLVLTHFSARYQSVTETSPSIKDIENEASAIFSGHLILAEDFARYRLKKTGEFFRVDNNN